MLHVNPLLRSSSARTDRGNGFVVSSLCSPAFFPLPLCAAGVGERPPPPRLLLPVARVKSYASRTVRLGGVDNPPVRLYFVQRRCLWWFSRNELRTVRYSGADGPPLKLEICPETMSLVEFAGLSCGRSAMESDSPPLNLGFVQRHCRLWWIG